MSAAMDFAGLAVEETLRPADGAELSRILTELGRSGRAALVRGGGTHLGPLNAPRRGDVILSSEALAGIHELDADEGVVQVGAGTPLATLQREARAVGWEAPFDPPGDATTIGGLLAAAAVGPRVLGFGRPRDGVLGLDAVLPTGERTRCGGRVVKNVTGYDLAKLYVGSFGTLAVLERAWLRLRALPEACEARVRPAPDAPEEAMSATLAASRAPTARVAACFDGHVLVELAGPSAAVARDAARVGGEAVSGERVDQLRARLADPSEGGLAFRVAATASGLVRAASLLAGVGASLVGMPGSGLLWAAFAAPADETAADAAFRAVRAAARAAGGSWRLESAPRFARSGRDAFGEPDAGLPLFRALKARFDPDRVLNPGCFMGGL